MLVYQRVIISPSRMVKTSDWSMKNSDFTEYDVTLRILCAIFKETGGNWLINAIPKTESHLKLISVVGGPIATVIPSYLICLVKPTIPKKWRKAKGWMVRAIWVLGKFQEKTNVNFSLTIVGYLYTCIRTYIHTSIHTYIHTHWYIPNPHLFSP